MAKYIEGSIKVLIFFSEILYEILNHRVQKMMYLITVFLFQIFKKIKVVLLFSFVTLVICIYISLCRKPWKGMDIWTVFDMHV